jgi:Ca2+:H+ antiporter
LVEVSAFLIMPTAFNMAFKNIKPTDSFNSILTLSRRMSIMLLIFYVLHLFFKLRTHTRVFNYTDPGDVEEEEGEEEDEERYLLSPQAAMAAIPAITIIIVICAEYLIGAVDDVVHTLHVNKIFIGLIIFPIAGNAAKQVTAIAATVKNKLNFALTLVFSSSMETALLITPSLVMLGWIIDQPISLGFEPFIAVMFFLSVIIVKILVSDGRLNAIEGEMLVGVYRTPLLICRQYRH